MAAIARVLSILSVTTLVVLCFAQVAALAQSLPTEDVFSRFSNRVVKIEVQESGSKAKASIGSGFFVSDAGHLVTNYHVIAQVVQHPDRYVASYVDEDDESVSVDVNVLNVDVAHDLALVKAELRSPSFFALEPVEAPQGLRLYSMGHPLDLRLLSYWLGIGGLNWHRRGAPYPQHRQRARTTVS